MNHFYVLIDQDSEGELIYKILSQQNRMLEIHSASGSFPIWYFYYKDNEITVYGVALKRRPIGNNREEIEQQILTALDLI